MYREYLKKISSYKSKAEIKTGQECSSEIFQVEEGAVSVNNVHSTFVTDGSPLVIEFSFKNAPKIFTREVQSHVILFLEKTTDTFSTVLENFTKAAEEFKGEVLFVTFNTNRKDNKEIIHGLGLTDEEFPLVRIITDADQKIFNQYKQQHNDLSVNGIRYFVASFLDGNLMPLKHTDDEVSDVEDHASNHFELKQANKKAVLLKVMLLGGSRLGKTSIMNQFVCKRFSDLYKATIGTDFLTKKEVIDDKEVTLQIWDTAGTGRFQTSGINFYHDTNCALLVFDLMNRDTFKQLERLQQEFLTDAHVRHPENFPFIVVGNKTDLKNRAVTREEVQNWCKSIGNVPYFETSAKEIDTIEEVFHTVVSKALLQGEAEDI